MQMTNQVLRYVLRVAASDSTNRAHISLSFMICEKMQHNAVMMNEFQAVIRANEGLGCRIHLIFEEIYLLLELLLLTNVQLMLLGHLGGQSLDLDLANIILFPK